VGRLYRSVAGSHPTGSPNIRVLALPPERRAEFLSSLPMQAPSGSSAAAAVPAPPIASAQDFAGHTPIV
jgi:hypothetical protein